MIQAARLVGFFTNLRDGTWWARLQVTVFGQRLRYLAAVQKLGQGETGVMVVTCWAELLEPSEDQAANDDGEGVTTKMTPQAILDLGPDDGVTILYTDEPGERWEQVAGLVERTLAASLDRFGQELA